jgi:hypothetical protein
VRSPRALAALALGVSVLTALLVRPPATVRLDVGGVSGGYLGAGWSESDRTDLNVEARALDPSTADPERIFRLRAASSGAELRLPIVANGVAVRLSLRALARVRTLAILHVDGRPAGSFGVARGPWHTDVVELDPLALGGEPLALSLTLRALPMVRVPDVYVAQPLLWVSSIEVSSRGGFRFSPGARVSFGLAPLAVFAFLAMVGVPCGASLLISLVAAAATVALAQAAPLPTLLAIPRLLAAALLAGLSVRLAFRLGGESPREAGWLAALVAGGVLAHGSLAFVPGFDPYDVEVHVRRALDLGALSFDYASLIRYGSHLPTPTQTFGTATAALGEQTLIPYSPLAYLAYYPLHLLGIDLHWGMTVLNAAVAMAVTPLLWLVARSLWGTGAAWVAALLYALDLPVWHHLGRSHAPAVFGNALGVGALAYLASESARLGDRRRALVAAAVLGIAALGYSSLIVLFGFFGLTLLGVLALDAAGLGPAQKRGLAMALALGGLVSGVLFYFHYIPGLLRGLGNVESGPDPFPGRTFLIFHNESRQSMRIWDAGFLWPLALGVFAAPIALRRAPQAARPVLVSWLAAWAMTMIAKEPFLFPRPLRWAKEEQFLSPLLALLIGAATWSLPRAWQRWCAATVLVAGALWLEAGDFARHATGQMP